MRITANTMTQNFLNNLEQIEDRLNRLQNEITSSTRITKPSDDPVNTERILNANHNLTRIEQWKNNIDYAVSFANTVDSHMAHLQEITGRALELATQGANGTLSDSERKAISEEINNIIKDVVSVANTKVSGRFAFGGTVSVNPLQDEDAAWAGNDVLPTAEIGSNLTENFSVSGNTLFNNPILKRADGTNLPGVVAVLKNLKSALDNNDAAKVSSLIPDISANIDNISLHRAQLGAKVNFFTSVQQKLENSEVDLKQQLSNLKDTDIAKSISELVNQQTVYKAALSSGAQIMQLSLVDFLK